MNKYLRLALMSGGVAPHPKPSGSAIAIMGVLVSECLMIAQLNNGGATS
jgi:hypothetical protein